MADLALSTVHALLGVIGKEAELLAGVRGNVQFIRDEMESINGLLRHLAGTKERDSDHQVRAWIKQVMELAYDFNNCVERLRLLRVLDLDGCGVAVTKRHLDNTCKIRKLRYLSLRGTNVAQLPKLLHRLELLETLDIRQTRVRVFDAALPRSLKHLLAGRIDCPREHDAATFKAKQTFSTVSMPAGVPAGSLDKLEILSHVQVSDSREELAKLGENLKRLRKLGVVLCGGEKANLSDLFTQINHLHGTLRSLSIRMKPIACWGSNEVVLSTPPLLLESLRISGVRGWLPHRIKELKNLAKLTLRDTLLDAESLAVVGVLKGLRCLRLLYHSFHGGELAFGDDTFLSLAGLVVEDGMVKTITFAAGAAPKLAKIAWSFQRMESMEGVKNLGSLRSVELKRPAGNGGECRQLQQEINEHPNKPRLVVVFQPLNNPMADGQADHGTGAALRP
uniref:Disease resistance R13L4/SHOC-2-like LRR domain-containing protein n=1 Tax=Oryza brachyantha TaxID=4533 RepID=J3N9Y8_ORYBR